jgi:hypothetical protein
MNAILRDSKTQWRWFSYVNALEMSLLLHIYTSRECTGNIFRLFLLRNICMHWTHAAPSVTLQGGSRIVKLCGIKQCQNATCLFFLFWEPSLRISIPENVKFVNFLRHY